MTKKWVMRAFDTISAQFWVKFETWIESFLSRFSVDFIQIWVEITQFWVKMTQNWVMRAFHSKLSQKIFLLKSKALFTWVKRAFDSILSCFDIFLSSLLPIYCSASLVLFRMASQAFWVIILSHGGTIKFLCEPNFYVHVASATYILFSPLYIRQTRLKYDHKHTGSSFLLETITVQY